MTRLPRRTPQNGRTRIALIGLGAICAVLMAETQALALQGGEDPALLPVLLDKRFGAKSRHHLGISFSTSIAAKFVEATGVVGSYTYGFSDLLGVELQGGYFLGRESSIMDQVRRNLGDDGQLDNEVYKLSDLNQLTWLAAANLVLVPIYGKMSFASEFDPSFDLFALVGVGAIGSRRQRGFDDFKEFDSSTTLAFDFGVGLRFYFNRLVALRFEFRDYFFPDPSPAGGLTYSFQMQAGLQFTFGGDQ